MDEHESISDLFQRCVRIALELDYFSKKSLAVLRRCNKALKARVDPKLTTFKLDVKDITKFLRCGLNETVETLAIKEFRDDYPWGDSPIFSTFLTTPMPKLRDLAVSLRDSTEEIDLGDGSIIGWPGITSLKFSSFAGRVLPSWISRLENLKVLNLHSCPNLNILPHWITNLTSLKELGLTDLPFSHLPRLLGCLSNLTKLVLESCPHLTTVSPLILTQLSNLQNLHLVDLSIEEIPEDITNLRALSSLNVHGCSVRDPDAPPMVTEILPLPDLRTLTQLQVLNIDLHPPIGYLPGWVRSMMDLREIAIDYYDWEFLYNEEDDEEGSIGNSVPLSDLQKLTALSINASRASSDEIMSNEIWDLTALKSLTLVDAKWDVHKSLWHIPGSIGKLTNLTQLRLDGIKIEELPWEIGNLQSLRTLSLLYCRSLIEIPESLGLLIGLKKLYLYGCNALKELPDSVGNLSALTAFSFESCKCLKALPDSISKLTGIESLSIRYCERLQVLPESLGYMNLSKLHIGKLSTLASLPSSIGNLKLEILTVTECDNLLTLPDSLSSLVTLKELEIEDCGRIQQLPSNIGNLTQLSILSIAGCRGLNVLPASMTSLTTLRHLYLGERRIILDDEIFSNFPLLTSLKLNKFFQRRKFPKSLWGLVALQELDLETLKLESFPEAFGNLIGLRNLGITDNISSFLNLPKSLGNLTALQKVTLFGCDSLISLPDEFCALKSLEELHMVSCYKFVSLPEELGKLSSLRILSIVGLKQLPSLPESIGQLSSLEELDLNRTKKLQCLPASISNCTFLRRLTLLSCTSLNALPEDMSPLQRLRQLNLLECHSLKTLPDSLGELSKLIILRVDDWGPLYRSSIVSELKSYGVRISTMDISRHGRWDW